MKNKVVLFSQLPLPNNTISSWPKLFNYYFNYAEQIKIDVIICPDVEKIARYRNIQYFIVKNSYFINLYLKIKKTKYYFYLCHAASLINNSDGVVTFLIIDNYNLLFELDIFLNRRKIRNKANIIFFIHGYSYFFNSTRAELFYTSVDHMVFLSQKSYEHELNRIHTISSKVSILPNGVDINLFYPFEEKKKMELLVSHKLFDKKIFLWCANDRPKKGLHIFLDAWKRSNLFNDDLYMLLVLGTELSSDFGNIRFLGKIPNEKLPNYYNLADFYFFTTLCHEGFGLSLAEALACGLKCVSSNIEPLKSIFECYGSIVFVNNPNYVETWIEVLESISCNRIDFPQRNDILLQSQLSLERWCNNLNIIVND